MACKVKNTYHLALYRKVCWPLVWNMSWWTEPSSSASSSCIRQCVSLGKRNVWHGEESKLASCPALQLTQRDLPLLRYHVFKMWRLDTTSTCQTLLVVFSAKVVHGSPVSKIQLKNCSNWTSQSPCSGPWAPSRAALGSGALGAIGTWWAQTIVGSVAAITFAVYKEWGWVPHIWRCEENQFSSL